MMRFQTSLCSVVTFCLALSCLCEGRIQAEEQDSETQNVKVKDLTLKLPVSWKKADNVSTMRLGTFHTPVADGDQEPGELTIFSFPGGGGDVTANISRWIGQFESDGRSAKIVKGTAGAQEYYLVNISGTYKRSIGPPIQQKTEPVEGFRMLGVILEVPEKGVYYLKLTGPDATIKAQEDAFRKSFGGAAEQESDFEL